ncbi:unnamed protein product [Callosobruchus maculatus]|uniref:DNA-directed DNA polymerase n=1 Tax=Callosobruchus maculatus TaxID=64391 RepID=A0A653CX23_CALMS|nr:unnamed protein product [Callosobruchus maculatus]
MNNDLFMNDTLDNINFSQDLITKDVSAVKNSQNKPPNAPQNWASEEIKKKEILLDDSVFLSGSLETDVSNEKENTPLSNKVDALNEIQSRKGKQPNEFIKDPCFSEPHCTKYSGQTSISEKTPKKEKDSLSNEASQIDFDNACKLSSWGFPNEILQKYESKNLHKMFRWQVECLNKQDVLKNYKNLVYAAPTSAGKTLVAEILALKTVLERKKKVIFILPFISIVQEKMYYFQDLLGSSGVRVEGFMGSYNPPGGFSTVQVAICTIEKANSLINRLLEEEKVSDVGAILVDEIHMLGDPSRGYLLELLLTKLLYISKKNENIKLQIIGMSATLPNLDQLAKWLNAELYTTDFRPIPLYELVHVCGEIYDKDLKLLRKLKPLEGVATDTDNILQLCLETIQESCSVLIFCPTKNWCESLAQQIAVSFCKLGNAKNQWGELLRLQLNTNLIMEVLEQLKFCPVGLDDFGALRVLVATSTLSSGVNLPARRVIVRTTVFHQGRPLGPLTYRQMIGRAGRMGKDTMGESILVCQRNDYRVAKALLNAPLAPVQSSSGVASTPEDVDLFARCTLLAATTNARGDSNSDSDAEEALENPIEEAVTFLKDNEFIRLQKQDDGTETYAATSLGKACLSSSVAPDEGLALFTELDKARQCFVLETELHLIYLKLPRSMKKVGELVGVRESYLVSATRGKLHTDTTKSYHKLLVHKRFFVALALQDLVNEKPLGWERLQFGVSRDLLDLMRLPILNGKIARTLFNAGVETVAQLANAKPAHVEEVLYKATPFETVKGKEGESEYAQKQRNRFRNVWVTGKEGLTEREAAEMLVNEARKYLKLEMGLVDAKWNADTSEANVEVTNVAKDTHQEPSTNQREVNGKSEQDKAEKIEKQTSDDIPKAEHCKDVEMSIQNVSSDCSLFGSETNISNSSINEPLPQILLNNGQNEEISNKRSPEDNQNMPNTSIRESSHEFLKSSHSEEISNKNAFKIAGNDNQNMPNCSIRESSPECLKSNHSEEISNKKIAENGQANGNQNVLNATYVKDDFESFSNVNLSDIEHAVSSNEHSKDSPSKRREVSDALSSSSSRELNISSGSACSPVNVTLDKMQSDESLFDSFNLHLSGSSSEEKNVAGGAEMDTMAVLQDAFAESFDKDCSSDIFDTSEDEAETKKRKNASMGAATPSKRLKGCGGSEMIPVSLSFAEDKFCDGDAVDLNRIEVVNVCDDSGLFDLFAGELKRQQGIKLAQLAGRCKGVGSIALDISSSVEAKKRSAIEAVLTWHLVDSLKKHLETDVIVCLSRMELNGISVKKTVFQELEETLKAQLAAIERKAYSLAGRRFNFVSSTDVAKVIGMFRGRKVSTRKQVLEKNDHPISELVLTWRKVNCTLTKTLYPLMRVWISCRKAFGAPDGRCLLSADYCQLELRILTHLSREPLLVNIMRQPGDDVFRLIAAKWNKVDVHKVDDRMRQHTKHLCYGIIYGMGTKALSEQLEIEEEDALAFMETFKNTYPALKTFIRETVEKCRRNGYVETLTGRRRYLPNINDDTDPTKKGSAADIAKRAMITVQRDFRKAFDSTSIPKLVLQLHDELLYEVPSPDKHLRKAALILKKGMERSVRLSVPFPL